MPDLNKNGLDQSSEQIFSHFIENQAKWLNSKIQKLNQKAIEKMQQCNSDFTYHPTLISKSAQKLDGTVKQVSPCR